MCSNEIDIIRTYYIHAWNRNAIVYIVYNILIFCIYSTFIYGGYFCFILLCVSNIWAQCMVCMYLIDAYCCDTGWKNCLDKGIWERSHCSSRAITTAWSWCECTAQGKECIVVLYCNCNNTTVVYLTQQQ